MGLVVRLIIFVAICCAAAYFAPDGGNAGHVFSLLVAMGAALVIASPEGGQYLHWDGTSENVPGCALVGLGIFLWIIALVVYIVALHEAA